MARIGYSGLGLAILMSVCSPLGALAQDIWRPWDSPDMTNRSIQTVGGITYFIHTSAVGNGCLRVAPGPVIRSETNLLQTINVEQWLSE